MHYSQSTEGETEAQQDELLAQSHTQTRASHTSGERQGRETNDSESMFVPFYHSCLCKTALIHSKTIYWAPTMYQAQCEALVIEQWKNKQKSLPPKSLHSPGKTTWFCDLVKSSSSLVGSRWRGKAECKDGWTRHLCFSPRSHQRGTCPAWAFVRRMMVHELWRFLPDSVLSSAIF